ncbi:uncharacterized protein EI90DRAFT_3292122 [Cantharellus anzutake]|uniref:uncharacterized protein n=1 Tax=Cantharellus anzutake TaxID=1750568 RepID=UPI001904457E|nr:uncharacterized protein EI90DRAFT_3292122 [Cantharellus anzutake]KAF8324430.1 hypothetical protein EI90DRAFT_3292122 [Cantharellus anzutake]
MTTIPKEKLVNPKNTSAHQQVKKPDPKLFSVESLQRSRAEAWEAAKLDNETLLQNWEALKEVCYSRGEKPPQQRVLPRVQRLKRVLMMIFLGLGSSSEDGLSSEDEVLICVVVAVRTVGAGGKVVTGLRAIRPWEIHLHHVSNHLSPTSACLSSYVARLTLVGRLGKDPETRTTRNNKEYVTYLVGTTNPSLAPGPEGVRPPPTTSWHKIISFSESQNNFLRTLVKGTLVFVEADYQSKEPDRSADPTSPEAQRQILLTHAHLKILKKPVVPPSEI